MRAPVRIVRSAVPLGVPPETKKVREPAILSLQEGGRGESGRSQTLAVKPVSSLTGVAVKLQHSASNPRPWRHTGSPRSVERGTRWNRILSSYAISGPNPRKNLPIARFFPQVDPIHPLTFSAWPVFAGSGVILFPGSCGRRRRAGQETTARASLYKANFSPALDGRAVVKSRL